jgi:chorismate mutase-like protein
MTEPDTDLSGLRAEIDRIDDQIHDLLMRRTALAGEVRKAKRSDTATAYRPARETAILRRLLGRHKGALPKTVLTRIWREIMTAMLRLQGPFAVAVYAPESVGAYRDLARDHFGGAVPATIHQSTRSVVNAVTEANTTVGVLPLPVDEDADPWWPALTEYAGDGPWIIARLPVARLDEGPDALVIGPMPHEASGADRSYVMIRASVDVSRASLGASLARLGMKPVYMTSRADPGTPDLTHFLFEVEGHVAIDDPRLAKMIEPDDAPARTADVLGGYALPFTDSELGADARR